MNFIILAVLLLITSVASFFFPKVRAKRIIAGSIIGALALGIVGTFFAAIPKGHVGVVDVFGQVKTEYGLFEGLHVTPPWWTITLKETRVLALEQTGEREIELLARNALQIRADAVVLAQANAEHAWCTVQKLQDGAWSPIVVSTFRTVIREAGAEYAAEGLVTTERKAFAAKVLREMQTRLPKLLSKAGCPETTITVRDIQIRKLTLPAKVREAVDERVVAQQAVERMEHVLARERKEAERKEIEADGIAAFQRTVSEGISPQLLDWRGIEATRQLAASANAKIVIIGGSANGMPLISPSGNGGAMPGLLINTGPETAPRTGAKSSTGP